MIRALCFLVITAVASLPNSGHAERICTDFGRVGSTFHKVVIFAGITAEYEICTSKIIIDEDSEEQDKEKNVAPLEVYILVKEDFDYYERSPNALVPAPTVEGRKNCGLYNLKHNEKLVVKAQPEIDNDNRARSTHVSFCRYTIPRY